MQGWRRRAAIVGVALAVAAPALRSEPADGFPFSSYPMFSTDRGSVVDVATAVGIDGGGAVRRLDPHAVGGGDEVMLAASTVRNAVDDGPAAIARLCAEIADRLTGDGVAVVEIRTERHDSIDWFGGDREPIDVVVDDRCPVAAP